MKFVLFYHSVISDWNHGNAHFLRGVACELQARGHEVCIYEPKDAWSLQNLLRDGGAAAVAAFRQQFPTLWPVQYDERSLDLDAALADADVVLVHEWNSPALVARIGQAKCRHGFRLLFHDTHHRVVSAPHELRQFDLQHYDAVLAFGEVIRQAYLTGGWAQRAYTWHEAADTRLFHPLPHAPAPAGDLVWIGNWGDDERSAELLRFLIRPVQRLRLRATVYGVRYPQVALNALADAGIRYGGWLPNHRVPEVFAAYRLTVHVPRRYYVQQLPGIPTIRPFEAMACGIPLLSAPWQDAEHLFRPGDIRFVRSGREMERCLHYLLSHPEKAALQARQALDTVRARHTCANRTDELLAVLDHLPARRGIQLAPESRTYPVHPAESQSAPSVPVRHA